MDKYELKSTEFGDNLSSYFRTLREDGDLFDITLACDDDQLEAHKIILSASSVFFKSVIKRNPHSHPLLYLKGVKIDDLRPLLDFMYLGKTKVAQDHLETFLTLGKELGVKGLDRDEQTLDTEKTINEERNVDEYADIEKNAKLKMCRSPRMKSSKKSEIMNVNVKMEENAQTILNFDDSETGLEFGKTLFQNANIDEVLTNDSNITEASDMSIHSDIDAQIESLLVRVTNREGCRGWQCSECNKYSKFKANLKKHIEIHLEGLHFSCKYCDKVCKTRNSLNFHMHSSKPCRSKRISGV
eukprot:GFUD01041408.1.p1 GENE.GFUD01041408.1~~GFUD01041408.1.p1  ORF type:complete len:299 (-),score=62.60 GFUD01041408.1:57-953(-)